MSPTPHEVRTLVKAGTAALLLAGAVGAPAAQAAIPSASEVTHEYTCKFPIIDKVPVSIKFSSDIPSVIIQGINQPAYKFKAVATVKGTSARLVNTLNAGSIEGSVDASADLEFPDGFIQEDLWLPLAIEKWAPNALPYAGDVLFTASGSTPSIQVPTIGDAQFRLSQLGLSLIVKGQSGNIVNVRKLTTDFDGNPVPVDTTPNDFDVYCKLNDGESNVLAAFQVGGRPARKPWQVKELRSTAKSTSSIDLAWNAVTQSGGDAAIKEYRVYQGTSTTPVATVTGTSASISGLAAETMYSFKVAAVDDNGVAGDASAALSLTTDAPVVVPNTAPTVPTGLQVGPASVTSIALSWAASTDDVGVAGYNVYRDGVKVGTSATPSFTATGLQENTSYSFSVDAFDEPGLASEQSAAVIGKTKVTNPLDCPEGLACQGYKLAGTTQIKTLSKGVLPLKGGIDAELNVSDGKFTADLTLNPTSGRLISLSFLPVTVKISFAPSGKTTGTLDDQNTLRSKSLVRIKVSEVKLFGAIPLAGGNSCQTKSLSEINLTSTKAFEIFKGGTLTGSYAISDLNGCGPLNGLVSPLTAGKGNTISLNLAPKA